MTSADSSEPVGWLGATSIDRADPAELADFYARLLGWRRMHETPDGGVVVITNGSHNLAMMRVDNYRPPTWPDPGVPQQMHLDVAVDDLDTAVARAVELGARLVAEQPGPSVWRVLVDPAGHPFCVTTAHGG